MALGNPWASSVQGSQCGAPSISHRFRCNAARTVGLALTERTNNLNFPSFVTPIVGFPLKGGGFVRFVHLTKDIHRFFPLTNSNNNKVSASKKAEAEMINEVVVEEELQDDDDADWDNEDIEDELIVEDEAFLDNLPEEEGEGVEDITLGDIGNGHGVNLGQTKWGEKALVIAKGVLDEFGTNFSLYGFKVSLEGRVYVRIDKLSDKYGSPSIIEIESFSTIYGRRLEEAGQQGLLPNKLDLEVSSPGAERVVEVPNELLRFKDLPMLVRYIEEKSVHSSSGQEAEKDAVLELESLEIKSGKSVWKVADVRINREQAGKGRGLTRKQKDLRIQIPLSSLRLVQLHMDI